MLHKPYSGDLQFLEYGIRDMHVRTPHSMCVCFCTNIGEDCDFTAVSGKNGYSLVIVIAGASDVWLKMIFPSCIFSTYYTHYTVHIMKC